MGLIGLSAGMLCGALGIGGGVIIVPALNLLLGLPFRQAVALSLGNIVAVSLSSSMGYTKRGLVNFKVGLILELASVTGAVSGGIISSSINENLLKTILGIFLILSGLRLMLRREYEARDYNPVTSNLHHNPEFYRMVLALIGSFIAGLLSALLGIGGGVLKIPIILMILQLPVKEAVATSAFMVGITALSGLSIYIFRGYLKFNHFLPLVTGGIIGALIGLKINDIAKPVYLRLALGIILVAVGIRLIWFIKFIIN